MEDKTTSPKRIARLAGALYIIMSLFAPSALIYVPSHILVQSNATTTMSNMLVHEFLFRLSIVSQFTSNIIFVILALVLYRLLRQVSVFQAKLLVVFVVMEASLVYLFETLSLTSLMIAKGEILGSIATERKQDMIMLLLNIHRYGMIVLEIFWGLWLIPFGLCVYKSGFIPRVFGTCLIVGGIGWLSDSICFFLFPSANAFSSQVVMITGAIGEFPIMLWLVIKGVKTPKTNSQI